MVYEPRAEDDAMQGRPDITLAKSLFGWEPQIQLAEGLARTADYFRTVLSADGA